MDYTITPFKSLGNISLGLHRKEIRKLLKQPYIEFYRNEFSKMSIDFFEGLGLLINYDEKLLCEAVELVQPANPTLFTVKLLNIPYESAEEQIGEWDEELEIRNTGFTSYKFGVGAYAPNKDEYPYEAIESVIVFKKGYYDWLKY
jgi:hypothetical protein